MRIESAWLRNIFSKPIVQINEQTVYFVSNPEVIKQRELGYGDTVIIAFEPEDQFAKIIEINEASIQNATEDSYDICMKSKCRKN
jgi:hypothetical protein